MFGNKECTQPEGWQGLKSEHSTPVFEGKQIGQSFPIEFEREVIQLVRLLYSSLLGPLSEWVYIWVLCTYDVIYFGNK